MPLFALEQIVLLSFAVRESVAPCVWVPCPCRWEVCARARETVYRLGGRTRKSKKEERKYTWSQPSSLSPLRPRFFRYALPLPFLDTSSCTRIPTRINQYNTIVSRWSMVAEINNRNWRADRKSSVERTWSIVLEEMVNEKAREMFSQLFAKEKKKKESWKGHLKCERKAVKSCRGASSPLFSRSQKHEEEESGREKEREKREERKRQKESEKGWRQGGKTRGWKNLALEEWREERVGWLVYGSG